MATSLYFNGNKTNGVILPNDVTKLAIGNAGDFSCGFYVNLRPKVQTNNIDNHGLLSNYFNFGNAHGYVFQVDDSVGNLRFFAGANAYSSDTGVFTYNTWGWVFFTLTGTTLTGYINGASVWSQQVVRVVDDASTTAHGFMREYLGAGDAATRSVYGYVRDIISTQTLLSPTDITNIVAGTFPTLDIRYKCDEGVGHCVHDYSGNNNHGTINKPDWRKTGRTII